MSQSSTALPQMPPTSGVDGGEVAELFPAAAGYLNTATFGLPPATTKRAMHKAVDEWAGGRATAPGYDAAVAAARGSFARVVGVDPASVAVGSQASALVGMVAAGLPAGAEVVAPDCDFTSVLFPFLAASSSPRYDGRPAPGGPRLHVRLVPLEQVADAIGPQTRLVALSSVQSMDGRIADVAAVRAAADRHGARVLLDVTQSAGWLPLPMADIDFVVCAAYKWLLCPRGVAFLVVRPDRLAEVPPLAAGWYAGQDRWASIYGGPLRLAADARRLDVSPAWLAWAGAVPSLALIESVGVPTIHAHNVRLADRLRAELGGSTAGSVAGTARGGRRAGSTSSAHPGSPGSAIVSVSGIPDAAERLADAGLTASVRGAGVRVAFHVYNTEADVDRTLAALAG